MPESQFIHCDLAACNHAQWAEGNFIVFNFMISKAGRNVIFTTIGSPPHDNLVCVLAEVSNCWGWIWFSFLELIEVRDQHKKCHFFCSVSYFFSCQRRCWGMVRIVSKQEVKFLLHGQHPEVQPAVSEFLFLARPSFSGQRGSSSPVYTFVHKRVPMPVLVAQLSVRFSKPPHWQAALLCCQVAEENSLALLAHFTALATQTDTQAIGNASGTFTQHLAAAFNSPFRNWMLHITQTAATMFWR